MYKRKHQYQNGTSLVEFAFVAPLFFLLLFGIIEFSVILYDKAVITNASREGARAGILYQGNTDRTIGGTGLGSEKTNVETIVSNFVGSYLMSPGGASSITTIVTYTDASGDGTFNVGDTVTVNVQYPYAFLVLPAFAAGLSDFTLGATTVMRAE